MLSTTATLPVPAETAGLPRDAQFGAERGQIVCEPLVAQEAIDRRRAADAVDIAIDRIPAQFEPAKELQLSDWEIGGSQFLPRFLRDVMPEVGNDLVRESSDVPCGLNPRVQSEAAPDGS